MEKIIKKFLKEKKDSLMKSYPEIISMDFMPNPPRLVFTVSSPISISDVSLDYTKIPVEQQILQSETIDKSIPDSITPDPVSSKNKKSFDDWKKRYGKELLNENYESLNIPDAITPDPVSAKNKKSFDDWKKKYGK